MTFGVERSGLATRAKLFAVDVVAYEQDAYGYFGRVFEFLADAKPWVSVLVFYMACALRHNGLHG